MNSNEKNLLNQWDNILKAAKETVNYNPNSTYGVYQIYAELNTFHKDSETGNTVWDYIELNTALTGLKTLVKKYYIEEIVPILFEYEYLK